MGVYISMCVCACVKTQKKETDNSPSESPLAICSKTLSNLPTLSSILSTKFCNFIVIFSSFNELYLIDFG